MSDEVTDEGKGEGESFAELFESYSAGMNENVRVGDRITGKILSIGKESVFVDTGTKIDGMVDKAELINKEGQLPFKEGDMLELYVVAFNGNEIRLSKAISGSAGFNVIEEAYRNNIPVEGKVKSQVKGGFQVDMMQKRAFCPISQIDLKYVENPDEYVGKSYQFLVIQFEEGGKNIVLSRRELLKTEQEKVRKAFCEEMAVGSQLPGKVTRVMPYGAFVELFPGLEGMVHISEISWSRVEKSTEVLHMGDPVTVKVLGIEKGNKPNTLKISLSIKQVTGDPWEAIQGKFADGQKVTGRVTRCTNFGAFVEILPGVEGLVHLSEMSYKKRISKPEEVVQPGDMVSVVIKEIDFSKKRISLSIKDAEGDPWAGIEERYKAGQKIEGIFERKEKFGYFVSLEPGITGLIPISRIKQSLNAAAFEKLGMGQGIMVIIEEIHPEERRITLSPGDSKDDEEWRNFAAKKDEKPSGVFGEKLQEALRLKEGKD